MRQITPKKFHPGVLVLCAKVNPGDKPNYVQIHPLPGAGPTDCFLNVPKQIATFGGSLLHGWRITEIPGVFIEAEFHGIWQAPTGELIDVTPSQNGEPQTLFLADPTKTFDELSFTRRNNIRHALLDHPVVQAFIAQCEAIYRYEEECTDPTQPRLFRVDPGLYSGMKRRKQELMDQMARLPIGRNDPCRCGSGLKYKKCCGR